MDFVKYFDIQDENLLKSLREVTESFFEDILDEFHNDVDVLNYVKHYSDEYGNEDMEFDSEGVYNNIDDRLIEILSEFNPEVTNTAWNSGRGYSNLIDADKVFEEFNSSNEPDSTDFNQTYSYTQPDISADPIE